MCVVTLGGARRDCFSQCDAGAGVVQAVKRYRVFKR